MAKVYKLADGTEVSGAFTGLDGTRYPSNWIERATTEDFERVGVTVEEVEDPPPPPPGPPVVTPTAFRDLFTDAEKIAITTAAQENSALRVLLDDAASAERIDMGSPRVVGGVGALVQAGLLTEARGADVLAARQPPAPPIEEPAPEQPEDPPEDPAPEPPAEDGPQGGV